MISYCIVVIRPKFVRMLIDDLIRKTTAPYEIIVWLNIDDPAFEAYLKEKMKVGVPIRIIGKDPSNIGMAAFGPCFQHAKGTIITQLDDDVIRISPNMVETATFIFDRRKDVRHLSAAMWENDYYRIYGDWNKVYKPVDLSLDLYDGPIDGWFSMYHRDIRDLLLGVDNGYQSRMISIGYSVAQQLRATPGRRPAICRSLKVFHVKGPPMLNYYDMLDTHIWKLRQLKAPQKDIDHFVGSKKWVPAKREMETHVQQAYREIDRPVMLPVQKGSK